MNLEGAFPLTWPHGWPRRPAHQRQRAPFGRRAGQAVTMASVRFALEREIRLLGATAPIFSTNVELRLDGLPRSGQRNPGDPAAAVYFTLKKQRIAFACDKFDLAQHNLYAIALHIKAMRAQDRYGVGSIEQAFAGYAALPQEASGEPWWSVLGFQECPAHGSAADAVIDAQFRSKIKTAHPDHGGSVEQFQRITQAREAGLLWHRNGAQ